jgi:hypothetical protein
VSMDYYTEYCVLIPAGAKRERDWLEANWVKIATWWEEDQPGPCPVVDPGVVTTHDDVVSIPMWHMTSDGLVLESDEAAPPRLVADFVQAWLRRWHPKACFGFEVAYTASRHSTDAYGGVAYFVTAEDIDFVSTLDWLHDKIAAAEKRGLRHKG